MNDDRSAEDDHGSGDANSGLGTRLLAQRSWTFVMGVATLDGLPPAEGIEIAFAGRSNVGKSSLINALLGRRALARTSNTPGRTQELNFFTTDGVGLTLVDMPGYGYAKVPKAKSAAWTDLVFAYLRGRPNLRRVYLLIDSRHGIKTNDAEVLTLLDKAAVSYQIVLTKTDKPKAIELAATKKAVIAAIAKRPAAHPEILETSAESGAGLEPLRDEIVRIVHANGLL